MKTDILVIGSGIAGLSFAIKAARKRKDLSITILCKDKAEASNTQYAQGGIAAVVDPLKDNFEKHIQDTMAAGGGLCNEEVVRMVVTQAPARLQELADLGAGFDRDSHGSLELGLEGGHSAHRIVHCKDITGFEIERALLDAVEMLPNVTLLEDHFVTGLLKNGEHCCGATFISPSGCSSVIKARAIVLCTGGCGQLFSHTTNPAVATGDGVALALEAGAKIADMQYIQFHPTALFESAGKTHFLLSEALRGYGAHVVNEQGKRFLFRYDVRGELATRNVVTAAIRAEMDATGAECVFLDCRHLDPHALRAHFPAIYNYCLARSMDPAQQLLPILPAAHYQCGGIATDMFGHTTVPHLYAIGECARTGLHGSNRLASNSLLEATVFAHQAATAICATIDHITFINNNPPAPHTPPASPPLSHLKKLQRRLNTIMDTLFFNREGFDRDEFFSLQRQIMLECKAASLSRQACELRNMALTAGLIVDAVLSNVVVPKE